MKRVGKEEVGRGEMLRMEVGAQVKACCSAWGGELAGAQQPRSLTVINVELRL